MTKYIVKPRNKNLVLRKTLLSKEHPGSSGEFVYEKKQEKENEVFLVLEKASDCTSADIGDIVTAEYSQPIGEINGVEMFVVHDTKITTVLRIGS